MIRFALAASLFFPWALAGDLTGPMCDRPAACCAAEQTVEQGVCDPYVQITITIPGVGTVTGSGTAIKVGDQVLILTCSHVAEYCLDYDGGGVMRVLSATLTRGDKTWQASLTLLSGKRDLALLRPDSSEGLIPADYRGDVKLIRGEDVWYCGTPKGFHSSLERAIVNQVTPDGMVAVNGNGWYGNSGCGVYVRRGGRFVLVGVMVRLVWTDARAPILCEPQSEINRLLDMVKK